MVRRFNADISLSKRFDGERSDYEATKKSRFVRTRTGLAPQGGTADYHFRSEPKYYELLENCRDMDRNGDVIGQAVTRAVSNIIQEGFTLKPTTGDKDTDLELWTLWENFKKDSDACDVAGEMCWHDFETTAMRSIIVDGDCVVLGTKGGQFQFIEGHSIATKNRHVNTFLGVTMDKFRRRIKYWVAADPVQPGKGKETAVPVAVRDREGLRQLFHPRIATRSTLTRGVSAFAPIFMTEGMVGDIRFAKLVKEQVSSCFTLIRNRTTPGAMPPHMGAPATPGYGNSSTETSASGETKYIEGIGPGAEVIPPPGETLEGFSPNIVSSEFFQHIWLELSIIGANLGMPVCQMLLDFTNETFVGFRGATDEARKGFRTNQCNLIKTLHVPAYKFKVRQWADKSPTLAAKLKSGSADLFAHEWQPPSWPYLEPVNDAAGDLLRVRNGLTSRRRQMAERSLDWETVAEESVEDNAYAIRKAKEAAAELNKEFPDEEKVSWRDLMNLPTPDGIQVSLQTNKPSQESNPKTAGAKAHV